MSELTADALYNAGHWLIQQQRFEDAKHVFRTMLLMAATDERAWLGLGSCHDGCGERSVALQMFILGRATCPQSFRIRVALARTFRKLDREEDAQRCYEDASELATEADELAFARGIRNEAVSS